MSIKSPRITAGPEFSNDSYSATEEQIASGALFLDVLANDARRSSLYSLDDGDVADLFEQDQVLVGDQSRLGATIWITPEGQIGYALDTAHAQALAAGETFQDSFIYAVRLPNGSLVWSSVQVTITGTNDAPAARMDSSTVAEDGVSTGSVAANDLDVDNGAQLSFAAVGDLPAGFALASDGSWAFDGSDAAYQGLAAGETLQIVVRYSVTDEHGARAARRFSLPSPAQTTRRWQPPSPTAFVKTRPLRAC
jgi:VCBS repeat-containing protein